MDSHFKSNFLIFSSPIIFNKIDKYCLKQFVDNSSNPIINFLFSSINESLSLLLLFLDKALYEALNKLGVVVIKEIIESILKNTVSGKKYII